MPAKGVIVSASPFLSEKGFFILPSKDCRRTVFGARPADCAVGRAQEKMRGEKVSDVKKQLKVLVSGGAMIALAQILSYIVLFEMPSGGSVTAASMAPILVFALLFGTKNGIAAGMIYGLLQFILGPKWSFHPVSILFDYVFAFGMLGVAGFFNVQKRAQVVLGTVLAVMGRLVCSVISGVVVFASYAPEGQHPLVYSVLYNAGYLIPELVITGIVVVLLAPRLYAFSIKEE
jgi:thiamine transporter